MNIEKMVDRSAAIRTITDPSTAIKQRIQRSADDLNLAGKLAERMGFANEAIHKLVTLVYAPDTDGLFCNVDPKTGLLLIPAPWGREGYKAYGLRQTEAIITRMVLMGRQRQLEKMPAKDRERYPQLFYYVQDWRKWVANLDAYPTYNDALNWLKSGPLTLQEWKIAVGIAQQKRQSSS